MTIYHYHAQIISLHGKVLSYADGSYPAPEPISTKEEYSKVRQAIYNEVMNGPGETWPDGAKCFIVSLSCLN